MKVKKIVVSYGQTVPGDRQFESERFDFSLEMETETKEEGNPGRAKKLGKKMFEEVMAAVEGKSGRVMRRKKTDD